MGNFPDVTGGFRCWAAPENTHKRLILGFLSVTHHHHLPSTPHTCHRIGMNCGDDVDESALGNGLLVIIYPDNPGIPNLVCLLAVGGAYCCGLAAWGGTLFF